VPLGPVSDRLDTAVDGESPVFLGQVLGPF
jgi:hypothetical protein